MRGALADLESAQPAAPVILSQNKKTSMSAQSSATVTAAYPYQSIFTWHALADCRPAGVLDGRDQFRTEWFHRVNASNGPRNSSSDDDLIRNVAAR